LSWDLLRKAIGEYVDVMVKGGVASGNHGHTGRPGHVGGSGESGKEGSALHAKNPCKVSVSGGTAQAQANVKAALLYLDKKDVPTDCKITIANLGGIYGQSKGKNIYIDQKSAVKEHPLFLAAVIYHEGVHSGQDYRKMDSSRREFDARWKTRMWASMRPKGADAKELTALKRVDKESRMGG